MGTLFTVLIGIASIIAGIAGFLELLDRRRKIIAKNKDRSERLGEAVKEALIQLAINESSPNMNSYHKAKGILDELNHHEVGIFERTCFHYDHLNIVEYLRQYEDIFNRRSRCLNIHTRPNEKFDSLEREKAVKAKRAAIRPEYVLVLSEADELCIKISENFPQWKIPHQGRTQEDLWQRAYVVFNNRDVSQSNIRRDGPERRIGFKIDGITI